MVLGGCGTDGFDSKPLQRSPELPCVMLFVASASGQTQKSAGQKAMGTHDGGNEENAKLHIHYIL